MENKSKSFVSLNNAVMAAEGAVTTISRVELNLLRKQATTQPEKCTSSESCGPEVT